MGFLIALTYLLFIAYKLGQGTLVSKGKVDTSDALYRYRLDSRGRSAGAAGTSFKHLDDKEE